MQTLLIFSWVLCRYRDLADMKVFQDPGVRPDVFSFKNARFCLCFAPKAQNSVLGGTPSGRKNIILTPKIIHFLRVKNTVGNQGFSHGAFFSGWAEYCVSFGDAL